MNPKFRGRSISIYYNHNKIARFESEFTYRQIHKAVEKFIRADIPILAVIYGMPGSGKTFLAHLLSEQLLHCMILERDTMYAIGNNCTANKKVIQDDTFSREFFAYICDVFLKSLRCNLIIPSNTEKQLETILKYDGYDKLVVSFDRITIDESVKCGIHKLDKPSTIEIYGEWKTYEEILNQGEM